MQRVRVTTGILFLGICAAASAGAQTLDQSYFASDGWGLIVSNGQTLAQTFTVGRTERLNRVDVQIARYAGGNPPSDLIMEVRSVQGDGSPSDTILASASVSSDSIPVSTSSAFVSYDFQSANLDVGAGHKYAIVLRTDAGPVGENGGVDPYAWYADVQGQYLRGKSYIAHPPESPAFTETAFSFGFRTYTSVVPGPSALLTASLGLLPGVTLLLRRRRQ